MVYAIIHTLVENPLHGRVQKAAQRGLHERPASKMMDAEDGPARRCLFHRWDKAGGFVPRHGKDVGIRLHPGAIGEEDGGHSAIRQLQRSSAGGSFRAAMQNGSQRARTAPAVCL